MKIKRCLVAMFWNLKNRSSMYIPNISYDTMVNYINGYTSSVKDMEGVDVNGLFYEWLYKKEGKHFSICWEHYILQKYCKMDKVIAADYIIEFWEDFLLDSDTSLFCPPN